MTEYCGTAKARFERCVAFDTKRQFMLDYIEKIVFRDDHVTVHGSVPILRHGEADPGDSTRISFCIPSRISMDEMRRSRGDVVSARMNHGMVKLAYAGKAL